ncbi:MAG: ABC transporter ATP-binding protein [Candidatus Riflebacteria bacterium]|nr:ABC transporter ATP-binding protein [Candidatus Riflebacteria bacterium]
METININQLNMSYNGHPVLNDVSVQIEMGKVVALLGRNGAGKTTLLNIINGELKPVSGNTSTLGIDPEQNPALLRQSCVLVSEECHLYPWMTAQTLARVFSPMYPTWNQALYEATLVQFGISMSQKISTFSKGTKRKLQLAFALATEARILLLDEPVGGVDVVAREEILNSLIESLVEKGVTVVLSSHELNDISGVCDHILILSGGRFVVNNSKDELVEKIRKVNVMLENPVETMPVHPSILAAKANGTELELVVKDYSEPELNKILANFKVKSISSSGLSLEDLFKAVTRSEKS